MRNYIDASHLLSFILFVFLFPFSGTAQTVESNPERQLTQADSLYFTDISFSAGIASENSPRIGGHGAAFTDVDGDGFPDLFITMLLDEIPLSDLFFHNSGNGEFEEQAELRGIADFDGGSHGLAFGDLDNDGDFDLINAATYGTNGLGAINHIYRNDGSGFFTNFTDESGITQRDWPTRGVVTFDMDADGDLDIFAVTNFRGSNDPPGENNEVYRNDGDMTFTAINFGDLFEAPAGQGATDTDFDGDGDIDIIAGNRWGDLNVLVNNGLGGFTLVPPAELGIQHWGREGATMGDIDNDGDLDMLLPDWDFEQEFFIKHLYVNDGDGTFTYDRTFTDTKGYMGGFADLDNDSDLDIVFSGDNKCYLNDGSGNFSEGPAVPVSDAESPRAIAFADIDNDGDLDFAIGVKQTRNWLIRNEFNSGNWLKVKLVSPHGQAGSFGSKVMVYPAGQITEGDLLGYREARSNNGYLGQNDPVLHFGLAEHPVVDVVVRFLDETSIVETDVAANQIITIDASVAGPQVPIMSEFNPPSGQVGDTIRINGQNFATISGIRFSGVTAENYTILHDSAMDVEIPPDAKSGLVRARNDKGVGTSNAPFIVVYQPEITSFGPEIATVGMEVQVRGENFDEVDAVLFNGVESDDVTIDFPSRLRAVIPEGATSGPITISNSAGSATSDAPMTIVPESIDISAPNGGETFASETQQTISWSFLGPFDLVDLAFSANNGADWLAIGDNVENDGSFEWTVPEVNSESCLIRISKSTDASVFDVSDDVFKIDTGTLELASPNGGESWPVGSIQQVRWNSTGNIDSVNLMLSPDNGRNWESFAIVENGGNFEWQIPDVVSDSCRVRILDQGDNFPEDVSDDVFMIDRAPAVVITPNGGERWLAGSTESVTWITDGSLDSVMLELSTDHGQSWASIAQIPNTGDYLLQVPNVVSDSCLVRITDMNGGDVFDTSDDIFAIDIVDHVEEESSTVPSEYKLFANYPNPFNLETKIRFDLPQSGMVNLIIYNTKGESIRFLINERVSAGQHVVSWNGRDSAGRTVSSGVYFYQLSAGAFKAVGKMLVIK